MADFFFFGTMCHAPLLQEVLGRKPETLPARLADHAVHWVEGRAFPLIIAQAGAEARGLLVRGVTAHDAARLDFYQGGFARLAREVSVDTEKGMLKARAYFADKGQWQPGAIWSLADWQARYGAAVVATARDIMALYKVKPAQAVMARARQMLDRGAARVRAQSLAPATMRRKTAQGDIAVATRTEPYARFFAVEEQELRFRRFDGTMSSSVLRAAFISGDAVTVLPYDPVRDRVLLVEQFRFGPHARGDGNPWQLEVIAGRIDAGESPEEAAIREAEEEAGLRLGALLPMAQFYPSPGTSAEFLYSFLALADLPDKAAGVHGVADEAEDIRGHLVGFDALMALVDSGEIGNSPTILAALWLARQRARLRQEARGQSA